MLAGKGNDCLVWAFTLSQVVGNGMEVFYCAVNTARHQHGPRLSADLAGSKHLFVEMIYYNFRLFADSVFVAFDITAQLLLCSFFVECRVIFYFLDQFVIAGNRRVVAQHVQDETLLDGLLHGIAVEWQVSHHAVRLWLLYSENLQCLVLGRGSKSKIAGVGEQLLGLNKTVDPVFYRLVVILFSGFGKSLCQGCGSAPSLA